MAREPGARFESARELVDSLRETLDLDTEEVGAVVTVPEPGEDQAAVRTGGGRTKSAVRTASPTKHLASPTAPTIRADPDQVLGDTGAPALTPSKSGAATNGSHRDPPGEAEAAEGVAEEADDDGPEIEVGDALLSSLPAPAPSKPRTGLAVWVALVALGIGAGGTLVAAQYLDLEQPSLSKGRTAVPQRRATPPAKTQTQWKTPPASSDHPALSVPPPTVGSGEAGASGSAAPPTSADIEGDVRPPDEWRPKEIDGKLIKPDWARPDTPSEPPAPAPPAPYDDNPYQ
jgi:hypothetical protein